MSIDDRQMAGWHDDYSHSIRGNVGLSADDGYHLHGHGDPEGDMGKGLYNPATWTAKAGTIFNDRRKKTEDV